MVVSKRGTRSAKGWALSARDRGRIISWILRHGPAELGLGAGLWTPRRIARLMRGAMGFHASRGDVAHILRALGVEAPPIWARGAGTVPRPRGWQVLGLLTMRVGAGGNLVWDAAGRPGTTVLVVAGDKGFFVQRLRGRLTPLGFVAFLKKVRRIAGGPIIIAFRHLPVLESKVVAAYLARSRLSVRIHVTDDRAKGRGLPIAAASAPGTRAVSPRAKAHVKKVAKKKCMARKKAIAKVARRRGSTRARSASGPPQPEPLPVSPLGLCYPLPPFGVSYSLPSWGAMADACLEWVEKFSKSGPMPPSVCPEPAPPKKIPTLTMNPPLMEISTPPQVPTVAESVCPPGRKFESIPFEQSEDVQVEIVKERFFRWPGSAWMKGPSIDRVSFAIAAPPVVSAGTAFLLEVWAHLAGQLQEVRKRIAERPSKPEIVGGKGPVRVARGGTLQVAVRIDGMVVESGEEEILWDGEPANAQFRVAVPPDAAQGVRQGSAMIRLGGVPLARVLFELCVGTRQATPAELPARQRDVRCAMASYASADRDEVFARIQGMQKVRPDLDVFADVADLRSGERWEDRLEAEIRARDAMFLFWSRAASQSKHVDKEWRTGLRLRGLDFIDPMPLASPEEVPPPEELSGLHFNDWTLAYRRAHR